LDTYRILSLPTYLIHAGGQFAIHTLADIHPDLPFTSTVFRTNYFSFVFVKDGEGGYTPTNNLLKRCRVLFIAGQLWSTFTGEWSGYQLVGMG